ncbi:MAG: aspartate aminotransferase family protein [Elusimicrobia bacterium]|nr:aspartate aminotransferase family protein [Elusimicrobiota bacterium]
MAKASILEKPEFSKDILSSWTAEEVLEARQKHILPSTLTYYTKPLMVSRAEGAYLYDEKGKKYLDAFAGVVTVSIGHCHPHWVKRIQYQIGTFAHSTTLYLYPQLVEFAQKLIKMVKPANPALDVCFFTNAGCEANELAAILAKNYTGRSEFLALRHSFHGRTLMAMSFTGQSLWRHSMPYVFGVYHAPANYTYRRPEGTTPKQYAHWCADEVEEIIKYSTSGKIAAYIAEPIAGFGGVIDPEPDYFPRVYEIVKKHGGLFISDEVQTGVGRTGKKFLGIEQWGVRPDIVTMAKGLGNGYPLGAVVTTREVAESMRGKVHFNTFGGSPVAMAAGLAVLEVLEKEKLPQNAAEVGGYLKQKLLKVMENQSLVGEVRGKGLMLGVELVKDKKTKEPASQELLKVMDLAKERGLVLGKGGMAGNVLRIKPPLCITKKEADFIAEVLEESLKRVR